jgi:hypothetical protein
VITKDVIYNAALGDDDACSTVAAEINAARSVDVNQITAAVDERQRFREAVKWFEGEYATELSDPNLKSLLYARDAELAQSNPTLSYRDRLQLAGDQIREWHNRTAGKRSDAGLSDDDTTEHVERDVSQRRPATKVRAAVREDLDGEPSAEEVSDVIQQMARSRGQNVAAKHVWKVRG